MNTKGFWKAGHLSCFCFLFYDEDVQCLRGKKKQLTIELYSTMYEKQH